ncbi:hypothetical protein ABNX05_10905 [Lysinibacillus sp. M3]|uniref:Uncharacterized protein n=1 Tax=Lysinibacillus zambalensis TaxID=3160866 RepID=A0ABV1MRK0_9BACI
MTIRYVGIDPSSMTGFFIQDERGNIIVETDLFYTYKKDPERMIYIAEEIIKKLNIETDIICIENFSYNSVGQGIDYQFGVGWIIREHLHKAGFTYYDVSPKGLKKFATGNGNSSKKTMVVPIEKRWGFKHPSDNVTDAFILSEIAKAIDQGSEYEGLKLHEKQVVSVVKNSILNIEQWKEIKPPPWMNPRSKYYFKREGLDEEIQSK